MTKARLIQLLADEQEAAIRLAEKNATLSRALDVVLLERGAAMAKCQDLQDELDRWRARRDNPRAVLDDLGDLAGVSVVRSPALRHGTAYVDRWDVSIRRPEPPKADK